MSTHSRMAWITVYVDVREMYVGYRKNSYAHYFCPLPTVVIRIRKKRMWAPSHGQ